MLEDFLPLVEKPARYINSEINAVHKNLADVRTKVCLFFPDTYEVGMSHLGLRILYDILNKRPDTACERVFSPWTDYEERLRSLGRPLTSLESNLPVSAFDIVGVSLQYELSYTNVLTGLELSRIPLYSRDRGDAHPIVVAGGPCAVNPEPLADFIDVFFIGEAEDALHELVETRQRHPSRTRFLEEIAKLDGFYVPLFGPSPVRRRFLKDLDAAPFPSRPLLPLFKPVHDRVTVEVARGCIRGCRFCQAGIIYRPFRERSSVHVKDILHRSLACTGYEELSLASLSSGDYSGIEQLVVDLVEQYRENRVSVSLPSLRVGTLTAPMIEAISGTRKTGFTLAPEAGSERLRRVINKPVSDLDLIQTAETIFANGWNVIKLYFMIGLPTETDEDLDGIIRLANELLARGRRISKRHVQINITVSVFVPKPHTPFQWFSQTGIEEVRRRQAYLEKGLRKRGINLKLHDARTSMLEAAFARGGRELGRVIEEAVRIGCRFDGWSERFDFGKWESAFKACALDLAAAASRRLGVEDSLPWDHVKTGVTKQFLKQEYERACAAEISGNCREVCRHCGIACTAGGSESLGRAPQPERTSGEAKPGPVRPASTPEMTTRVRMKYSKTGRLRFLSHLDFITLMHRIITLARVPVAFSQGFNPHPKVSFGPALPVGIESESEYLDIEIDPFGELQDIQAALNKVLPDGVRVLESRVIPRNISSLSGSISRYEYRVAVPDARIDGLAGRVDRFLSQPSVIVTRETRTHDIKPCIEALSAADGNLLITLRDHNQVKPRIQDVVAQLFEPGPDHAAEFRITRTGLYMQHRGTWVTPLEAV